MDAEIRGKITEILIQTQFAHWIDKPLEELTALERRKKNMTDSDMLEELLELDEGLDSWTLEFIETLSHWDGDFTPRQQETLHKKWEKYCNGD